MVVIVRRVSDDGAQDAPGEPDASIYNQIMGPDEEVPVEQPVAADTPEVVEQRVAAMCVLATGTVGVLLRVQSEDNCTTLLADWHHRVAESWRAGATLVTSKHANAEVTGVGTVLVEAMTRKTDKGASVWCVLLSFRDATRTRLHSVLLNNNNPNRENADRLFVALGGVREHVVHGGPAANAVTPLHRAIQMVQGAAAAGGQ